MLYQILNDFVLASPTDVVGGTPGVEIWRFTTAHKGQQILLFDYRRPWDTEAPPLRQLSFTVTVR